MTPEQIRELTDIELNRAMVWCYPPTQIIIFDSGRGIIDVWGGRTSYLEDWNLTMPLVEKHCIDMTFFEDGIYVSGYTDGQDSENDSSLRAICEVLLMIKLCK